MKLNVSVNFDFKQLSNKMNGLIEDYTNGYAQDTVKGTRRNIDRGVGSDGNSLKLGSGSYRHGEQALYNTGNMYNTLKSNKNTLIIKGYGAKHNFGKFRVRSGTNVRNFIGTTKENQEKLNKKFIKNLQKSLHSNKRFYKLS
tara:strand:- start:1761 stop:2186 length:426 start_codon:yes stop_codon:yes gene_type:complete